MVSPTPGRTGRYTPPWPGIATSGGWDQHAQQGGHRDDVPYPRLRQTWPWPLLTMVRRRGKTQESHRVVEAWEPRYREGCVPHVPHGAGPSRSQSLAMSLAQAVVSPPISLRRLDHAHGHRVTSH